MASETSASTQAPASRQERRQAMAISRRNRAVWYAANHHRNVKGEPLQFDDFFYMLDIIADPSPKRVIMSAVQTGKTESFICSLMADLSLGLSCFYVLPTQDTRNVFVPNRIDRIFATVPEYAKLRDEAVGRSDNVLLKHIGPGAVRFGASNAISEFKEFPADVLYVDEYDVCDPDGLSLALDRTKASPYRFVNYLANPTLPGVEFRHNIAWHFDNSDAKRIFYRCSACGAEQWLNWFSNVVQPVVHGGVVVDYAVRDANAHREGRRIEAVCELCGEVFDRQRDVIGWVATGDPAHEVSGYHISRLNCLIDEVHDLHQTFLAAMGNETALRVFVNSDLGLPYEGGLGNKLTETLVGQCVEQYELPHTARGPCSMGVDVGSTLDVRISDHVRDEDTGHVRRRLVAVAKCREISEVIELGRRHRVAVAVIDSFPESRMAIDFQNRAPFRVWRCQYKPTEGKSVKSLAWHENEGNPPGSERYVTVDRTEAMDSVYQQYVRREVVEPPGFGQLLGGRYLGELSAPVRTADEDGRTFWIKAVDHQFHANVYDWIASQDPMGGFFVASEAIVRGTERSYPKGDDYGAVHAHSRIVRRKAMPTWGDLMR